MKKLLVLNQYASTPKYSSGAGERFFYMAPYLKEKGYEVTIVSGGFNHLFLSYPSTPKLFNTERIKGGEMVWVRLRSYRGESFLGRFLSWFEFLVKLFKLPIDQGNPPNVVLVSSMSIFPIFHALYLKRRFKSKVILEIRDIWPLTPMELGGYSRYNPVIVFMGMVEKYAYRNSDQLVSVLPGFNKHVENVLGFAKPVHWIPNGCNSSISSAPPQGETLNLDPAFFNILYTGALGIANAMEFIVEAADILQSHTRVRFIIIGDGPEKENLVKQAEGLNNILFYPKVAKENLHFILSKADVTIISWRNKRLYEYGVSANKYNDYMLAGKPIISASNIKDDPVTLAGCGFQVPAENPKAIAAAVLKASQLPLEANERLGKSGRDFVLKNQTYQSISNKYHAVLKKVEGSST